MMSQSLQQAPAPPVSSLIFRDIWIKRTFARACCGSVLGCLQQPPRSNSGHHEVTMRHPPLMSPLLALCACRLVASIDLDLNSTDSIKAAAGMIAYDMMSYYKGNLSGQIPGQLPGPPPNPSITNAGYFWWEAGGMWGSMIDYWYYTGDTTYNEVVKEGILFQVGPDNNFLPLNQTSGMGNDDQGFWGLTAMLAAELNFTNPAPSQPQWLALAQAVHNIQAGKIDNVCGGGLRWQAYSFLNGYNYKNSVANGCFFNTAARLALFTGNDTYAQTAETTWTWMNTVGLIDADGNVYDGTDSNPGPLGNCTVINKEQYSYNAGLWLLGAATMYNYTTDPTAQALWKQRTKTLLNATISVFFTNGIGYERQCEGALASCTIDMLSFKAYLTRYMAATTKFAPFTYDSIMPILQTSANAAALQCSGSLTGGSALGSFSTVGRQCGLSWYKQGVFDGTSGVGQEMAALEVIQSNLIQQAQAPLTSSTGGTSVGDPSAGTGTDSSSSDPTAAGPATTKGKVGAGFLTAAVTLVVVGGTAWLSMPDKKSVAIVKGFKG